MTYPTVASRDVAAPAEKVWALASDLPMAEWSADRCRVTDSWGDHRARCVKVVGRVLGDHGAAQAKAEMAATLANMASAAQS